MRPATPPTATPGRSAGPAARRMSPGGFSALLLLAVTVQMSLAMLEWAGPGSADTRQRLATTIVAAAHRGVFTEPARSERAKGPRTGEGVPCGPAAARPGRPESAALRLRAVPWASALPPPVA